MAGFCCMGCSYLRVSISFRDYYLSQVASSYWSNSVWNQRLTDKLNSVNHLTSAVFIRVSSLKCFLAAGSLFLLFGAPILLIAFLGIAYLVLCGEEEFHGYVMYLSRKLHFKPATLLFGWRRS